MSKKPKTPSSPRPADPVVEAFPLTSESPDWPEMAENGREIEISGLSFRQQSALPIIAVSRNLAQASRDSGVAERTLRRWLQDPVFSQQLELLRLEAYDLARKQTQATLPHCIAMLADMAAESEDPAVRLRAIRTLLYYGVKFGDFDKLNERLRLLEETVEIHQSASPLP